MKNKLPKDIHAFLAAETKPYYTRFWGKRHLVKPALVHEPIGDGRQVIYLEPIDTRPNHYVLCIDSQTDISADGFDYDSIIAACEDEYGSENDYEVKYNAAGHYVCRYYYPDKGERWKSADKVMAWPMVRWGGGRWGVLKNFGPVSGKSIVRNVKRKAA